VTRNPSQADSGMTRAVSLTRRAAAPFTMTVGHRRAVITDCVTGPGTPATVTVTGPSHVTTDRHRDRQLTRQASRSEPRTRQNAYRPPLLRDARPVPGLAGAGINAGAGPAVSAGRCRT
jgi:hypothetical protein